VNKDKPTYRLVLVAEGAGPPPAVRLRRLLKSALRAYGLRCVRVDMPAEAPAPDPAARDQDAEAEDKG
jgi:hypothetical protein